MPKTIIVQEILFHRISFLEKETQEVIEKEKDGKVEKETKKGKQTIITVEYSLLDKNGIVVQKKDDTILCEELSGEYQKTIGKILSFVKEKISGREGM